MLNENEIIIICNAYREKLIEYILNNKLTINFDFALEIQKKGLLEKYIFGSQKKFGTKKLVWGPQESFEIRINDLVSPQNR